MFPEDLKIVWITIRLIGIGLAIAGFQYFGNNIGFIGLGILVFGVALEAFMRSKN